jgi:hypothetical protein
MRSGGLPRAGVATVAFLLIPPAAAQTAQPARWSVAGREARGRPTGAPLASASPVLPRAVIDLRPPPISARTAPWWAPIASAIIPGSGQALQKQRRAIAYLAVDGFLLAQYADAARNGRTRRREYWRLARIARSFYTNRFPTGDFEYYERMEQFVESGAFDLNPGGDLEPETDTLTFNGITWRLARETFWENPEAEPPPESEAFRSALDFYARRAVQPEFRWSWRNAQLEQDLFRRTIERSNGAFRLSSEFLGMIIANHALSAVDAFIVVRLRRGVGPDARYRLSARVPWEPFERRRVPRARR